MKLDYILDIVEMETRINGGYFNFILPDFMVFEDLLTHVENLEITLFYVNGAYIYNAISQRDQRTSQFVIYDIKMWVKEMSFWIEEYINDE